jgi:hypothetical protein
MLTASSALHIAARMPRRPKNSLGPLILYHGCDREFTFGLTVQIAHSIGQKIAKSVVHKRWEILLCWEPLRIQGTVSI